MENSISAQPNNNGFMKNIFSKFQTNNDTTMNNINTTFEPSNTNNSYFSTISWIFIALAIIISLILYFFIYYPSSFKSITLEMNYYFTIISDLFSNFFQKTVHGSTDFAKDVIRGTSDTIDSSVQNTQKSFTPNDTSTSLTSESVEETQQTKQNNTQNSLNNSVNDPYAKSTKSPPSEPDYEASNAHSTVNSSAKGAWCYIGEAHGVRSCSNLGQNQECMSGDIFPTSELCINPNLRGNVK